MKYQFVDCRWELGNPSRGRDLYLCGHIPGASFLDVDNDLSSPAGARGRHPLPDPEEFARAAGQAGIGDGVFVVAYGNMGGAERLWWLVRHYGHDACAVIEFDGWHGPLTMRDEEIEPAHFTLRPRDDDTIEAGELDRRRGELVVVDARLAPRWRGEPNPIDKVPGRDRKSTRLNSSHLGTSYAVFCLKKKKKNRSTSPTIEKKKKTHDTLKE